MSHDHAKPLTVEALKARMNDVPADAFLEGRASALIRVAEMGASLKGEMLDHWKAKNVPADPREGDYAVRNLCNFEMGFRNQISQVGYEMREVITAAIADKDAETANFVSRAGLMALVALGEMHAKLAFFEQAKIEYFGVSPEQEGHVHDPLAIVDLLMDFIAAKPMLMDAKTGELVAEEVAMTSGKELDEFMASRRASGQSIH